MSKLANRLQTLINNISKDFSVEKMSKSPARFDTQKLNWFNRQYIQMMSLDEFTVRASNLKLAQVKNDLKLRVGDYVYLVDLDTQKCFVEVMPDPEIGVDGNIYHQMGGGREDSEDSIECLIREVEEESNGLLKLDRSKIKHLVSYQLLFEKPRLAENPQTKIHEMYDGKVHNIYFYEIKQQDLPPLTNNEKETFEWRDLTQVLAKNTYITYPVWKQFCLANNIKLVEPTHEILQQYLAWQLDKNRITLLSEFGTESGCILNWKKPTQEEVSWKKISREESISNLNEILSIIEKCYSDINLDLRSKQDTLYNNLKMEIISNSDNKTDQNLAELASVWEVELKKWITENSKDAGSYFWPLRVALSGKQKSPSPFEILSILSLEEVKNRIGKVLK